MNKGLTFEAERKFVAGDILKSSLLLFGKK